MTEQLAITHPLDRLRPFLRKAMLIRDPDVIKRHYPNIPPHLWDVFDKALVKDMDLGETWLPSDEKQYRRVKSEPGRKALIEKTTARSIRRKRRMIILMSSEAKSVTELWKELQKKNGKDKAASETWVRRTIKKMYDEGHVDVAHTEGDGFHTRYYKATKSGIQAYV